MTIDKGKRTTLRRIESAGFEERRFNTGEIEMNYVVGPNHGPALVLVPAQIGTWESYQRVLLPLSHKFQVYSIDIRGHGKSDWTTGDYSWESIGRDMTAFLKQVVRRPAIISGNSSGGLIALWSAANLPERVSAIILEDTPVFSAEMPRFRDEDRFVYQGLQHVVEALGDPKNRDLADYFRGQVLPVKGSRRERRVPDWFINILSRLIRRYEASHPGQPVEISYFPSTMRRLFKSLSTFDPDFARAFVDGRIYKGLDHAEALNRIKCPMLVLHANWFRHSKHGLVGAMDDRDAARIQTLVPHAQYKEIPANHVIHVFKPKIFVREVEAFAAQIENQLKPEVQ
ncbi:MAG: alpha/beta fold hydrolase [Anaerolineales bacterium]|nr:alpha/beta fold hydrolase [Anaerolineales bacterium]